MVMMAQFMKWNMNTKRMLNIKINCLLVPVLINFLEKPSQHV